LQHANGTSEQNGRTPLCLLLAFRIDVESNYLPIHEQIDQFLSELVDLLFHSTSKPDVRRFTSA
jgi:hypothetical protein